MTSDSARRGADDGLMDRLGVALCAVRSVGVALMAMRGREEVAAATREQGDQLKTPADAAAEAWVTALISSRFPGEPILAEEAHESSGATWHAPRDYWTIDALDGTRSYVGGFDGFCSQVAYVSGGVPLVGVIHEPVRDRTYWAIRSKGAWVRVGDTDTAIAPLDTGAGWPEHPRFADSTPPEGPVGALVRRTSGRLLECGSIGLKICRVAEGEAEVFAKALTFKLWDVAPGAAILDEVGGRIGLWDGSAIPFDGTVVYHDDLVAAPASLFGEVVAALSRAPSRTAPRVPSETPTSEEST